MAKKEMPVFQDFPELAALGQDRILTLATEWMQTPVAKECGITNVGVSQFFGRGETGPEIGPYRLTYQIDAPHDPSTPDVEQQYRFPLADFLKFLIERACPIEQHAEMKARVAAMRQRDPAAYQDFTTSNPQRLYIHCENPDCGARLETNLSLRPGEEIAWRNYHPVTCPECGHTHPVRPTDFFTEEDSSKGAAANNPTVQEMMRRDPTVRPFTIRIRAEIPDILNMCELLMCHLNDREFEGRPAETVMLAAMHKGARGTFADLFFVERPVSFNKFQNPSTGEWEHVRNTETNELFLPQPLADFTPITALKQLR